MKPDTTMCYVGIKPCGCCVAAMIDNDPTASMNFCAALILDGLTVEQKDAAWVGANLKRCRCGRPTAATLIKTTLPWEVPS